MLRKTRLPPRLRDRLRLPAKAPAVDGAGKVGKAA